MSADDAEIAGRVRRAVGAIPVDAEGAEGRVLEGGRRRRAAVRWAGAAALVAASTGTAGLLAAARRDEARPVVVATDPAPPPPAPPAVPPATPPEAALPDLAPLALPAGFALVDRFEVPAPASPGRQEWLRVYAEPADPLAAAGRSVGVAVAYPSSPRVHGRAQGPGLEAPVVRGRPATLVVPSDPRYLSSLAWTEEGRLEVTVHARGLGREELLAVAEGLEREAGGPQRGARLRPGVLPEGLELRFEGGTGAGYSVRHERPGPSPAAYELSVRRSTLPPEVVAWRVGDGERVGVRGRPAVLADPERSSADPGAQQPAVSLAWEEAPGVQAVVDAYGLSLDEVLRLSEGVAEEEVADRDGGPAAAAGGTVDPASEGVLPGATVLGRGESDGVAWVLQVLHDEARGGTCVYLLDGNGSSFEGDENGRWKTCADPGAAAVEGRATAVGVAEVAWGVAGADVAAVRVVLDDGGTAGAEPVAWGDAAGGRRFFAVQVPDGRRAEAVVALDAAGSELARGELARRELGG